MNKLPLLNLSLVASLFGLGACSAVAQQVDVAPPQTPKNLQVPSDQKLVLKTTARGSQIYVCQAKADNSERLEWTLKAPAAGLFDDQNHPLGQHYEGPTWEANDGSKVIGEVKAKANAPKAKTIPWLLLAARSHAGNGIFSQINWIVRVNTVGDTAPAEGCDRAYQNREIRVNYTADYYFYGTTVATSAPSSP
jgi:hypothetical protein